MGTTLGFIWLKAPTAALLSDLAQRLGQVEWLEEAGWHVATVRRYEDVASYLAGRVHPSAVGWVEDSSEAAVQLMSRRVGPVFLPVEHDEEMPVWPLTDRTPTVRGLEHVRQWCAEVGLPELDQERLNEVLARDEVYAEDKLEAAAEAIGLPRGPVLA